MISYSFVFEASFSLWNIQLTFESLRILFYISVLGDEGNFKKYNLKTIDVQEKLYDYGSIMHYGRTAFSKSPGLSTIVAINNKGELLGQRKHLSNGDVDELNLLYDCQSKSIILSFLAHLFSVTEHPRADNQNLYYGAEITSRRPKDGVGGQRME